MDWRLGRLRLSTESNDSCKVVIMVVGAAIDDFFTSEIVVKVTIHERSQVEIRQNREPEVRLQRET